MLLALTSLLSPAWAQAAPAAQTAEEFQYKGPTHQGTYAAEQIAAFVAESPDATHWVWQEGWASWRPAGQVDEISRALKPTWTYAGADGRTETLDAEQIAARVRSAPTAAHYVWRTGMASWQRAEDVREISAVLARTPPPLPDAGGPPPLPTESGPPPLPGTPGTAPAAAPAGRPGQAPRSPAPPTPPAAAPPAPAPSSGGVPAALDLGLEVRANLSATHLESAGADDPAAPATFGVALARVRPRIDLVLGEHVRTRTTFELHQDDGATEVTTDAGTVEVPEYADGWAIQGREVWIEVTGGERFDHRLRFGMQKPAFGVRDHYDAFSGWYMGGVEAYQDVERRAGVTYSEDAGLGYRVEGERFAADVQVLNGSGYKALDDNASKDVIARLSGTPVPWATVSGFAQRGDRGADGSLQMSQYGLAAELHGPHQRLVAEAWLGDTEVDGERQYAGGMAAAAWDFATPDPLDRVSVIARFMAYDPDLGDDFLKSTTAEYPDAWSSPAAAVVGYWKTPGDDVLLTGLTWESWIPQDAALPVNHSVVVQAAWKR